MFLDSLMPQIIYPESFCSGDTVFLSLSENYQNYEWNTGEQSSEIQVSAGGIYSINVSNDNGCFGGDLVAITEHPKPTLPGPQEDSICAGDQFLLELPGMGGNNPYTYNWNQGLGEGESHVVSPVSNTVYSVTLTDANECFTNSSVSVIVKEKPVLSIDGQDEICEEDEIEITYSGSINADNQYYWEFNEADITSGSNEGPYVLKYDEAGLYEIELLVDLNGCQDSVLKSILVNPSSETYIEMNACDSYVWNGTEYTESGLYTYETDNIHGCDSTVSLNLQLYPSYDTIVEIIVCDEEEVGTEIVTMMSQFGCDSTITEIYLLGPEINVNLVNDITIPFGEEIWIEATISGASDQIESIYWEGLVDPECPECLIQQFVPEESGVISIYVVDQNGCIYTDAMQITVLHSSDVFSPNIFSPNGDGVNDHFYLQGNSNRIQGIRQLNILDRWGNILFTKSGASLNDPNHGWDGSYKGKVVNPGVYLWFAEILLDDGTIVQHSGDITLIR